MSFYILCALSGIFLVLCVFLFFLFDIPKVVKDLRLASRMQKEGGNKKESPKKRKSTPKKKKDIMHSSPSAEDVGQMLIEASETTYLGQDEPAFLEREASTGYEEEEPEDVSPRLESIKEKYKDVEPIEMIVTDVQESEPGPEFKQKIRQMVDVTGLFDEDDLTDILTEAKTPDDDNVTDVLTIDEDYQSSTQILTIPDVDETGVLDDLFSGSSEDDGTDVLALPDDDGITDVLDAAFVELSEDDTDVLPVEDHDVTGILIHNVSDNETGIFQKNAHEDETGILKSDVEEEKTDILISDKQEEKTGYLVPETNSDEVTSVLKEKSDDVKTDYLTPKDLDEITGILNSLQLIEFNTQLLTESNKSENTGILRRDVDTNSKEEV